MQFRALAAAAALAVTAVASPVNAQENEAPKNTGFYATIGAGASWTGSTGNNSTSYNGSWTTGETFAGTFTPKLDLGAGFAGEAGVGYDFGDVRAELTYVYKGSSVGDITGSGSESGTLNGQVYSNFPYNFTLSGNGTVSTNSVFVSGYYDISTKSKFTPYVGGGLGYTNVSIPTQTGNATLSGGGITATQPVNVQGGSAGAFGYQAKAGVSYAASEKADVFLEGTYQGSTGVSVNTISYSPLNAFGLRAGVRFRFGK
jgi:opacity protein-like surface antigen